MLTKDQSSTLDSIMSLINSKHFRDPLLIRISGSAGTGKTYLAQQIVYNLRGRYSNIYATGLTNKAVAVLANKLNGVKSCTIHKLLKIKRKINDDGTVEYVTSLDEKTNPFTNVSVLIIDEVSMMDDYIYNLLVRSLSESRTICIMLGDSKQLPPVGSDNSPAFEADIENSFELTEIVRQSEGNPIIDLSRNLSLLASNENKIVDDCGYVFTNRLDQILDKLVESNGTNKYKYLAWTNQSVNTINSIVRKRLYGDNPNLLELGETIVFDEPYVGGGSIAYHTNDELLIENISVDTLSFYCPIEVRVKKDGGYVKTNHVDLKVYIINDGIYAIHEDDKNKYATLKSSIRKACKEGTVKWVDYYRFAENFIVFKYNHALTVHKSQGSTYETTIIDYTDMMRNTKTSELKKLLYTAVTRSSKRLIIFKR